MNKHRNFSPIDQDLIDGDTTIGTVSKEHEFPTEKKDGIVMTELVEKESPEEISTFVQSRQEEPRISSRLQKVGVENVATSPRYAVQKKIILPLTDDMVERGLHAPITSSFRWLAEWSVFLLKRAHIMLKKVHGHMKRIIQQ
ncbi:MAG TPA: hypothetical protein VJB63_00675 [Patescibacteria group bacterium]|nr:hypothetical protein [Patescibacteria group bacterium]